MKPTTIRFGSLTLVLLVFATLASMRPVTSEAQPGANASRAMASSTTAKAQVINGYGKLPLAFEVNNGQTDGRVKFLSRGGGYTLFLTGNEAVLALRSSQSSAGDNRKNVAQHPSSDAAALRGPLPIGTAALQGRLSLSSFNGKNGQNNEIEKPQDSPRRGPALQDQPNVLRMRLVGANANAVVTGVDELPGKSNYFIGNDPKKWRTNVPTYAKVRYSGVYPGVDLVYYGNQGGQLEYDFVVSPGADPKAIQLAVAAMSPSPHGNPATAGPPLQIDAHGDLILHSDSGDIRFQKPVVYQLTSDHGQRTTDSKPIEGRYVLQAGNRVGFEVSNYDHSKPLVIDPTLVYSTYLAGPSQCCYPNTTGSGIAVDASGSAYVTGNTSSPNFPTTSGAYQGSSGGVFVAKLNSAGTALVYSAILGPGSAGSIPGGPVAYPAGVEIAVDSSGSAYVTGVTNSANFPTTPGAFQPSQPLQSCYSGFYCGWTAFVTKLNATGSGLVYSTYLGGQGEWNSTIAIDSQGNAYVAGSTQSMNFPLMNSIQGFAPSGDIFVTKLNPTGSGLVYSTFLGGPSQCCGPSSAGEGIAVDSSGNAYVTGYTSSGSFPLVNPIQSTLKSHWNVIVSKLNATGSALVYSTYLGGSGYADQGSGIAVDSWGNAYVTGDTESSDFPITLQAFQTTLNGPQNAFVAKLNAAGSALAYSTYLGGSGDDAGFGIALDSSGNAYVTGAASSTNFPTLNPIQTANNGGKDAFVATLNASGSGVLFSTYLGGSGTDYGNGIALDSSGNAYVTGFTQGGSTFPTTPGAFQTAFATENSDAFVAKIALAAPTTTVLTSSLNPASAGDSVTFTATVTSSSGTPTGTVTFFNGQTMLSQVALGSSATLGGSTGGLAPAPLAVAASTSTLILEDADSLGAGSFNITAQYTPDTTSFAASSASIQQTVAMQGVALTNGSNTLTGNQAVNGTVTATAFSGDGSGLTNVTAAHATSADTATTANTANFATSAGAATTADTATNALSLGGILATSFARLDIGNSFVGTQSVSGDVSATGNLSGATGAFSSSLSAAGLLTASGGAALPATGNSPTSGSPSNPLDLIASASNGSAASNQTFRWQAVNVDGGSPSASLSLLFGAGNNAPAPTGLSVAPNGQITFASGQTFPGTGGVTSVGSGAGLLGGPITSAGTLSIDPNVVPLLGASNNAFAGNVSAANFIVNASAGGGFSGNGSGLTNLQSANLTGTIPDGNLPGDVARLGVANTFTSPQSVYANGNGANGNAALAATNPNGTGVYGTCAGCGAYGSLGASNNPVGSGPTGVVGNGGNVGVFGSGSNYGLYGISNGGDGVAGYSNSNNAVAGFGFNGVLGSGSNVGVTGVGHSGPGVVGQTASTSATVAAGLFNNIATGNAGNILLGQSAGVTEFSVDSKGDIAASGSVSIGGGTPITEHLSMVVTPGFANLNSLACTSANFTLTGAADGDTVALGVQNSMMNVDVPLVYTGWVSVANTITIRDCNFSGAKQKVAATGSIRIDLWRH
ncbi:MAG: beta strand repeat-containing protein [Terriglobia bacterium]